MNMMGNTGKEQEVNQVRLRLDRAGRPHWSMDFDKVAEDLKRNPNLKTVTHNILKLDNGEIVPEPFEILAIFPELAKGQSVPETKYRQVVKMLLDSKTEIPEEPDTEELAPTTPEPISTYVLPTQEELCKRANVKDDRSNIPVHPAAECTRMMDEEELASLAASIKANGQCDPIILGRVNGVVSLVDGRNRRKACEKAGVEARYETRDFEDDEAVKAFVASKSEHRNISKGQMAMRIALLWPEAKHGGARTRGASSETERDRIGSETKLGISKARYSQARQVLAYSRELAEAVRDGTTKLDAALKQIKAEPKLSQKCDSLGTVHDDTKRVEVSSTLSPPSGENMETESQQTIHKRCEHLECEREQLEQRCLQLESDIEQHKQVIRELKQEYEIKFQQGIEKAREEWHREMFE